MNSIRFGWLLGIGIASGILGWVVNFWTGRNGYPAPVLHLSSLLTVAMIITVTLVFGIRVLRWRNGKRDRELNPILAARTLILAQATAYAGALSLGWHAGILIDQVSLLAVRDAVGPVWGTLALMAGGILMVVVGLAVENFCRIPPEDEGGAGAPGPSEGEYA